MVQQVGDRPDEDEGLADERTLRDQGAAWGLACLGAIVLSIGWLGGPPSGPSPGLDCPRPRALRNERGFTRVVTCELPPGAGRPVLGPARWLFGGRVSLNEADSALLEALPRIGPGRARAILAERRRDPFATVDALDRAYGVGAATVEALAPFLRVDPPRSLESSSAKTDGER